MQLTKALLRTTALYAVFAALWIIFSDAIVATIAPKESVAPLQTTKGLFFVLITAILLYSIMKSQMKSVFYSESRLRTIFESIADALLLVDTDLNIINVNTAALALFGYPPDQREKLLRPLREVAEEFNFRDSAGQPVPEEEYASFKALQGETTRSRASRIQIPGGRRVELDISASPIVSKDTGIRGAVLVMRDVTEIRHLQQLRDEFLSTAAHEFKTPLAVIKANAQLLEITGSRWPEEKKNLALRMIDRQCQKANRLVQDLLMGSRMEKPGLQLKKASFEMLDIVEEVVTGMQELAPNHRLHFRKPSKGTPTRVLADRTRIEQVLLNLLDNAIKYSPRGGNIEINVYREGPRVWTSVSDSGVGIQREKQPRIFEKYYSAHAGTAMDFGGMGIGLNLSRESVLRHGGIIEFESKENAGSTFRFSLPLAHEVLHERSA